MKVYLNKNSTYKSTAKPTLEDELNDVEPLSESGMSPQVESNRPLGELEKTVHVVGIFSLCEACCRDPGLASSS
jgi:hypothetical protein